MTDINWAIGFAGLALTIGVSALVRVLTRDAPETDATRYDRRQREWERTHQATRRRSGGQALVEFALIAPVALAMALGFIEAGLLVNAKGEQDRATSVVAYWAAAHPGEDPQPVLEETGLDACIVTVEQDADVGLAIVHATCHYQPVATHGLWEGLPVSSEASAAAAPTPTPTAAPTP